MESGQLLGLILTFVVMVWLMPFIVRWAPPTRTVRGKRQETKANSWGYLKRCAAAGISARAVVGGALLLIGVAKAIVLALLGVALPFGNIMALIMLGGAPETELLIVRARMAGAIPAAVVTRLLPVANERIGTSSVATWRRGTRVRRADERDVGGRAP